MATSTEIPESKRPRFRLHRSTWLVLLLAAAALVLVIVPGEVLEHRPNEAIGVGDGLTMEHGWPWVALRRNINPPLVGNRPPPGLPHHGIPWLQKAGWSIEGKVEPAFPFAMNSWEEVGWWPAMLVLNLLVAFGILALIAAALERRHRRRRLWQFSLAELLILMLLVGCGLGWILDRRTYKAEQEAVRLFSTLPRQIDYRGPRLLRRAVGTDLLQPFHRVVEVFITPRNHAELARIADEFPSLEKIQFRPQTVTDADLTALARLRKLRSIDIRQSQITDAGLVHLRTLTQLRFLRLGTSPHVTSAGIEHLAGLPRLTDLHLSDTDIDNRCLRVIGRLRRMLALSLAGTRIDSDGLAELAKLSELRELDLSRTAVDDAGLEVLSKLRNLCGLSLANTKITGDGLIHISGLTKLEWLVLNETPVDDEGLVHVERLTRLTQIRLNGTRVTSTGVNRLRARLPNCIIVWQ